MRRRTLLAAGTSSAALAVGASAPRALAAADRQPGKGAAPSRGTVHETLYAPSSILGQKVPYALYLPPGHGTATEPLPVLFLLHGGGHDNHLSWIHEGRLAETVDKAIADKVVPPLVVAIPNAWRKPQLPWQGQQLTYYMNDLDGGFRYADMLVEEFVPYIERRWNAGGRTGRRGIGGLSMGGFGALSFAMREQGMFAGAFALSAGLHTREQLLALSTADWNLRFGSAWGRDLEGEDRLNEHYRAWNVLQRAADTPPADLSGTPYFQDCGAYDEFFEGNALLHMTLTRKNVPHRYRSREGWHDWAYWTSGLPGSLAFLAQQWNAVLKP